MSINDLETNLGRIELHDESSDNESDSPVEKLNHDCLIKIFKLLSIADRIRIERVCSKWKEISRMSWSSMNEL